MTNVVHTVEQEPNAAKTPYQRRKELRQARKLAEKEADARTTSDINTPVAPAIRKPTDAEVEAYLLKNGVVAMPAANVDLKSEPLKPTQRTEREPVYAMPVSEHTDAVVVRAHPTMDYVFVEDDDTFGRGPQRYRSKFKFQRVDVARSGEQDIILILADGTRQASGPNQILMARPKAVSEQMQREQDRLNDPHRDSPDDVHLTKTPSGQFFEEKTPIKGQQLAEGTVLPESSPRINEEANLREIASNRAKSPILESLLGRALDQIGLNEPLDSNITDD